MRLDKTGTILIASLWIVAILSILAIGIGFRVSLELRLSRYNMDRLKALYLAKAGIVKCQEILSRDSEEYDSIYECGITLSLEEKSDPEKFKAIFNVSLGEGAFSIGYNQEGEPYTGMSDEERKININTALQDLLKNFLMNIELDVGLSPAAASGIATSIIAWRSPGPGPDDYYYESHTSYRCKHEKFSAIEELLLVKDISQEIFDKVKDYVTVYGDGKININTASREVLRAAAQPAGLTETNVDDIIRFRNSPDGIFTNTNIDTELSKLGLTLEEVSKIKTFFTASSKCFRIESKGAIDRSRIEKKIVSVATKDEGGNFKLVSYREQ